ncbi:1-phosphatidylinositol 4,5-bisphosphate phosphodiesterase zeta-1-like isoform X2 [Narcine bancroftii]|uniref:1-phosphatidylinositol 4,5-bisphosphate phosphodiesterase zeta-1-like isoform X2 n=1 Tax=Narcine bancroftii TaxID=1343680 RepID=UPI003831F1F3
MASINTKDFVEAIEKVKHQKFRAGDFIYLYKVFTRRPEPQDLFKQYTSNGKNVTALDLLYFLKHEQQEINADECTALSIINSHNPVMKCKLKRKLMTYNGFLRYITSTDCSIFNQDHAKVYQRMDLPMTTYFIASSQDTFTSNQFIGQSDMNGYISALKKGCRCLELDCRDGPENEPRVYHGFALISMILVKDVIEVINMYAFETSEYPLILSLEINCKPIQQHVIANHLVNILEDKLITMNDMDDNLTQLSSPEELKGKILIKCKNAQMFSSKVFGMWHLADGEVRKFNPEAESEIMNVEPAEIRPLRMKEKRKVGLAMEFSNVLVYAKPVEFKDFKHSWNSQLFLESNSFSEHSAMKLVKQSACEFVAHNSKFLSRIYSVGIRRNHSNYKPHNFWNVGCHMVTLNYGIPGLGMDLNRGKFQDNGGCGYVLKPHFMTDGSKFYPLASKHTFDPIIAFIQIISGHHLPVCRPQSKISSDPCVQVEIYGVPTDSTIQQTKALPSAGYRVVPLLNPDGLSLSPAILFVYVWYA